MDAYQTDSADAEMRDGEGVVAMPNRHSSGSRDKNEKFITPIIKMYNIEYSLMPEGVGFDILVYLSPMICVEVKNPDQPQNKRALTPTERARKETCDLLGIPYFVVETPEEMSIIIAARI